MDKVNKIEADRIKVGCSCEYIQGRIRIFKIKECKACMHKKGLSVGRFNREEIIRNHERIKNIIKKAV